MTIKRVEINEADTLLAYSKKTFYDFFAHLNEPENMEAYSATAFTIENIREQLENPDSEFYFAVDNSDVVGYIKLNFNGAQTEFRNKDAVEIERIYVSREHHGKQIGEALLNFAIDTAKKRHLNYVWLGVWEHNHNALGFYRHNGFQQIGSHDFMLGTDRQTDLLMRRDI